MEFFWQTGLDILVLAFLAVMIAYSIRLSIHLKAFRDSRKDIEGLIENLSGHIERADLAIEGLRESARETGRDLQEQINEAKALSEELQFMTQSGGNLAKRLENAVEQNREGGNKPAFLHEVSVRDKGGDEPPESEFEEHPSSGFAIRDPELDQNDPAFDDKNVDGAIGEEGEWDDDGLQSRAEKELYEVLKQGRKAQAGGVS